jgi:lupus La protein
VRRKTALPNENELKRVIDGRSLYARPFSLNTTIEAVQTTFTEAGAKVNCVRLRRHKVCWVPYMQTWWIIS